MSRFVVDLREPQQEQQPTNFAEKQNAPQFGDYQKPKRRSVFLRVLGWLAIALTAVLIIAGIGAYFYWQSVKKTPAYSLALVVDAARRGDNAQLDQLVDTESVIENFMPQVTSKAVELYGRNLPPQTIARAEQAAAPLLPAVRARARSELPRVIREKTAPVEKVPYWLIALFANRAVDITVDGGTATVTSKIADRPLELTMRRNGERWKVTAIKDDILAQKIAEKIGQDIIASAAKNGLKKTGEQLGVQNADEILKSVQDIFK
ncbi:MAG: hypothetical protein ACR2GD_10255 [Pyrinomonadaceae bacterium]